jgi:hypothetical protein
MSGNICNICKKTFKRKDGLEYHKEKKVCNRKNVGVDKKPFECRYCERGFNSKSGMYKHMETCKEKAKKHNKKLNKTKGEDKKRMKNLEKTNKDLKNTLDIILKELKEIKKQNETKNNQTINIGNIGNINNNTINLIAHGKEDLTKLTKEEFLEILRSGYDSPIKLTEKIHFNPDRPENHNIYISNKKGKYALVFNGADWSSKNKKDVIQNLYEDKKDYIETYMSDYVADLTESRKKALKRWLDTPEEDAKIIRVKDALLMLLYDKREITKNTIEKNKFNNKQIRENANKQIKKKSKQQIQGESEEQIQGDLEEQIQEDLEEQIQEDLED